MSDIEREIIKCREEIRQLRQQRDRMVEAIGELISLPPDHIAGIYGVKYTGDNGGKSDTQPVIYDHENPEIRPIETVGYKTQAREVTE